MSNATFSVGIDLGTTHCVISYTALQQDNAEQVEQIIVEIPQLTNPGSIEHLPALPSFLYQPHNDEVSQDQLGLPWDHQGRFVVGEMARAFGSKTPIRLISSAKSWLCHPGIDRKAPLLPLDAPEEIDKLSPFQATVHYLEHLVAAWNHEQPEHPLTEQAVTITVPASFDPAARELTAEAARHTGLSHAILLEEPQAALYSWIQNSQGQWREQVSVGDVILVVDVGGGTTDFSLIAVTEQEGALQLNRIAVGDHILLGGDNMDLALAHVVRSKLAKEGKKLAPWQLQALTHACRHAKEQLLSDNPPEQIPIVVPNRGSSLIGGTLRTELTKDEVQHVLIEGFFPVVDANSQPISRTRGALTQMGLPYAQDPAMTKHLAAFLSRQKQATQELEGFHQAEHHSFLHPTAILFNGGVIKAPAIASRITQVVNQWLQSESDSDAKLLHGIDLDKAVARGAAYYGLVRQGQGVRIRGGTAHAYYVGVESAMPAVPGMEPPIEAYCIAPFGMEEGTEAELPEHQFGLVVGETVRFRFFSSAVRREDTVGTLLDFWSDDELEELPAIEVHLNSEHRQQGAIAPVQLMAAITEVGTLKLDALAVDSDEHWNVEFDTRGQTEIHEEDSYSESA